MTNETYKAAYEAANAAFLAYHAAITAAHWAIVDALAERARAERDASSAS